MPTPEEMKAWSQNLGHSEMLTTLTSYGTIATHRQLELVAGVGEANPTKPNELTLDDLEAFVSARRAGGGGF